MNLERLSPWNWFKSESESGENQVPVRYEPRDRPFPLSRLHEDIDRMFDDVFRGVGVPALFGQAGGITQGAIRPHLDIAERTDDYLITVEVPGVEQSDVDIELDGDSLVISGEKRQESTDESDSYHRVERSYGAFRRVLTLPRDVDRDRIDANFKDGVLKVSVAKQPDARSEARKIEIKRS